jgi:hypothetical protein
LRSARAARLPLAAASDPDAVLPPEDEPIVLPEPVEELVLPLVGGVEAADEEPVLPEAPIVAPAAPLPAGVPVAPIGVFCVLRWPAPVAASLVPVAPVVGGVLWATAVPTTATAARPASRALSWLEAVMRKLLFDLG